MCVCLCSRSLALSFSFWDLRNSWPQEGVLTQEQNGDCCWRFNSSVWNRINIHKKTSFFFLFTHEINCYLSRDFFSLRQLLLIKISQMIKSLLSDGSVFHYITKCYLFAVCPGCWLFLVAIEAFLFGQPHTPD